MDRRRTSVPRCQLAALEEPLDGEDDVLGDVDDEPDEELDELEEELDDEPSVDDELFEPLSADLAPARLSVR
jgi:hypothetical protein